MKRRGRKSLDPSITSTKWWKEVRYLPRVFCFSIRGPFACSMISTSWCRCGVLSNTFINLFLSTFAPEAPGISDTTTRKQHARTNSRDPIGRRLLDTDRFLSLWDVVEDLAAVTTSLTINLSQPNPPSVVLHLIVLYSLLIRTDLYTHNNQFFSSLLFFRCWCVSSLLSVVFLFTLSPAKNSPIHQKTFYIQYFATSIL